MLDVDRFGNSGFGSPMDSTGVHKSDRWKQSGEPSRQGRNQSSTGSAQGKQAAGLHIRTSKSFVICIFCRGKDSTRLLDFCNFFAGEGLI
jgi:hypothetical protein